MVPLLLLLTSCHPYVVDAFSFSTPSFSRPQGATPRKNDRTTKRRLRPAAALRANLLPSLPLISANDSWGNWATLAGTASLAQYLGQRTTVGRLLGPPVTAMALTFSMATLGLLAPGGTAAARSLQLLSLQLATPLILLGADVRDAGRRCGPLLLSFTVAAMGTVVACLTAWPLVGAALRNALSASAMDDGLIVAAALMAKNIGGGLNYMAVCTSLQASPTAIAAGLCVDNIFALVYFPITSLLASGRPDVSLVSDNDSGDDDDDGDDDVTANPNTCDQSTADKKTANITVESISLTLSMAASLLWLGTRLGGTTGALPLCTLLTVLFASRAPRHFLARVQAPAHILGTVCLYLFFATAGSPGLAIADSVRASILPLGLFLTLLYSIHGLILYLAHLWLGKRFKAFQVQPLLCASSASIGGPATAVALAEAFQWKALIVPSLLVGNIGYAVATFAGLAYHALFQ